MLPARYDNDDIYIYIYLILKCNVLIIIGDMNAQIDQDENNQLAYATCQTEMGNF